MRQDALVQPGNPLVMNFAKHLVSFLSIKLKIVNRKHI